MEKVKITRKQADLLDSILENTDKNWLFEQLSNFNGVTACTKNMSDLYSFYRSNPLLASKALIIGYEVEETPEDKVWNYYRELLQRNNDDGSEAVRTVLKLLGKEVRGINS